MRHPVGIQQPDDHLLQLRHGEIFPLGVHIVQPMFPNVRRHARGQERPRAVKRQHPPQLGGGNIDNVVFHQSDFCPPLFQLCLTFGNGGFFSLVSPVENAQLHIFQDVVGLLPLIEAQEHIATHEQNQLRVRIALLQLRYGLEGVADAAPVQLDVRNLGLRAVRRRNAQHFETLSRGGRVLRYRLVGSNTRGDDHELVEFQRRDRLLRRLNVAGVWGIEGSTVNADSFHLHRSCTCLSRKMRKKNSAAVPLWHRSGYFCFLCCRSRLCSMDFSMACSRKYWLRCSRA